MKTFTEFKTEFDALESEEVNTAEALDQVLEGYGEDVEDEELVKALEALLGSFTVVETYGGEGQGDDYYKVVHCADYDFYFQLTAYYQSFDGVQYDGAEITEVHPKTITKTVYE